MRFLGQGSCAVRGYMEQVSSQVKRLAEKFLRAPMESSLKIKQLIAKQLFILVTKNDFYYFLLINTRRVFGMAHTKRRK